MSDDKRERLARVWSEYKFRDDDAGEVVDEDASEASVEPPDELPEYGDDVRDANVARIEFTAGRTLNVGDFNSVRVAFGVDLPCHVTEIDAGFRVARDMVESRLRPFVEDVRDSNSLDEGDGWSDAGDTGPDEPKW